MEAKSRLEIKTFLLPSLLVYYPAETDKVAANLY
jgi:hypothetical protein